MRLAPFPDPMLRKQGYDSSERGKDFLLTQEFSAKTLGFRARGLSTCVILGIQVVAS